MEGWVKLYRELLAKSIWESSTPEQKCVLITVLLLASHKQKDWIWQGKRFTVKPGQFVTSLSSLASTAGVTIQNVRTSLVKLEKYEFLTSQSTNTGRLISIVNWELYQDDDEEPNKPSNKELTKSQQRANKELTTIKNVKNVRIKDKDINPLTPFSEKPIPELKNPEPQISKAEQTKKELREIRDSYKFGDTLNKAVDAWIKYKHERNDAYKPTGLKSLLTRIKNAADEYGEGNTATAIYESMASNYQGIVWDKAKKIAGRKESSAGNPFLDMLKAGELEND